MGVSDLFVRAGVRGSYLVRMATSKLFVDPELIAKAGKDDFAK